MKGQSTNPAEPTNARVRKKWLRSRAKLEKEHLQFSSSPSTHLVIANAGLANGMRREELDSLVAPYVTLTMPPQKSYAVLTVADTETAESLVEKLQGKVFKSESNLASQSLTFYLHYLNSIPTNPDYQYSGSIPSNKHPPGLHLIDNFITTDEEAALQVYLEGDSPGDTCGNHLKHRQVWHYGYEFRYAYSDVDPTDPLPAGIPPILGRVVSKIMETGFIKNKPDQITINKYEPGQGIPPHVDNPSAFEDGLASLSLGSQTVMDFEKESNERLSVLLKPRSLCIFTGESRYFWTHGICPRKVDLLPTGEGQHEPQLTPVNRGTRISVTFRKVRDDYKGPDKTSNMADQLVVSMNSLNAEDLENLHVHNVYNEIASHFTSTREKPWPRVKQFIDSMEAGSMILDVGCGSGRYLGVRNDVSMIGCDRSENLIGICREKGFEVLTCDGLSLPIRFGVFDACICIAVIHHYSTEERRKNSIEQLLASVRPGGRILISVWALEQEYKRIKSKYLKRIDDGPDKDGPTAQKDYPTEPCPVTPLKHDQTDITCSLPVHKNRTPFQQQDVLVPWHKKVISTKKEKEKTDACQAKHEENSVQNSDKKESSKMDGERETYHRYYHVFKKGELDDLCKSLSNVGIIDSYYDEGNWCVILEKSKS